MFKSILFGKYFWFFALTVHLCVLFVLYINFGFNFSNEADKYIYTAERLTSNNFSDLLRHQWFSSSYILFFVFCLKLGLSLTGILIVQFVFSLIGYYFFYKFLIGQNFFSEIYSKICLVLIMCSPLLLYWQLTLFSESFFIALSMITTYFTFNSINRKNLILTLIFGLLLMFCRPVGAFYVLGFMFVVLKLRGIRFTFILTTALYLTLCLLILFVIPLHFKGIVLPVLQGSVVCGFPLYPLDVNALADSTYDFNLMEVYLEFMERNGFGELMRLFFKKAISFFTLTRPYYSVTHNLINAFHYIFLVTAFYAVYDLKRKKELQLFLNYVSILVFSSALLVTLFYNEWSERYIVPLFPFFILLFVLFLSKMRKPIAI